MPDLSIFKLESKGMEKFWETVKYVISPNIDAKHLKKMTTIEIDRLKQLGELQIELETKSKIELARANRQIEYEDIEFYKEKLYRAQQRFLHDEIDNQNNIDNIIIEASKFIPENVSDIPVDKDWRRRFFTRAKEISIDDAQKIWSQILVKEISEPGSISYKTIDILYNLTKKEAVVFNKYCKNLIYVKYCDSNTDFIKQGSYISFPKFNFKNIKDINDLYITADDEILLSDLSLISESSRISILISNADTTYKKIIFLYNDHEIEINPKIYTDLYIRGRVLTKYGEELMNIIKPPSDTEYLKILQKYFLSKKGLF